jgi:hypothetical protein
MTVNLTHVNITGILLQTPEAHMSNDPLLQPYRLKHLTLRNRIMITSHEPAYPEDGMPKDRYRAYHARQPACVQQHPGLEGRGGGLDEGHGR